MITLPSYHEKSPTRLPLFFSNVEFNLKNTYFSLGEFSLDNN